MVRYFVSYLSFEKDGKLGFGYAQVQCDRPISGVEHLQEIAQQLQRDAGLSSVGIINFQRFEHLLQ